MRLKISEEGIVYDDDTQSAVGFIGRETPPAHIAWAPAAMLQQVMNAAEDGRVAIIINRRREMRREDDKRPSDASPIRW